MLALLLAAAAVPAIAHGSPARSPIEAERAFARDAQRLGQGGVTPPPDEFTGTIAEIQGTGPTSPHVGDIATTRGVVRAAWTSRR